MLMPKRTSDFNFLLSCRLQISSPNNK
uniref:Uncharacterized protein n=1 Tax=Rhizophora mucronata TaxID=61149 RepID=A0A2P2Q3C8_RHIMU